MEEQIRDYHSILEIGCGTGQSTEVLLSNGHKVVAIEENPSCLEETYLRLRKRFNVQKIKRANYTNHGDKFGIIYSEFIDPKTEYDLLLIDGNITFEDPYIMRYLAGKKFDAVICWLIGTDGYTRSHTIDEQNTESYHPTEYRFMVQNRIYDLAADWIKEDGILHFVDRGPCSSDPTQMKQYCDAHNDQAVTTKFIVSSESHLTIEYDPNLIANGVKMGSNQNDSQFKDLVCVPGLHAIKASLR
jgi:SAM-dependent methyltransferase